MAIKKIENVFLDGQNRAFGGYIYGVDYEANFAEQPSTLKVRIINESGSYNISKEDLSLTGSATIIKLGSKVTLYMYLVGYSFGEDSSGNKILEVEYLDESVIYLDRKVVKLRDQSKIIGNSLVTDNSTYANTIVLGQEDYTDIELSDTDASLATQIYPSINPAAVLRIAPVYYTFPQLLSSISSFVGVTPSLDGPAAAYKKDYMGKLREVLSAWCNDLGLGFYWENRKLNFVDLRNPANLNQVELLYNAIKSANSVTNYNYSYTLRDTFSRGIYGQYLKDGTAQFAASIGSNPTKNYYFTNLQIRNIPWLSPIDSYVSDSGGLAEKRIKAAKYGFGYFITALLTDPAFSSIDVNNFYNQGERIYYNRGIFTDSTILATITENTNVTSSNYNWYRIVYNAKSGFRETYNAYKCLADFYGSFFYLGIGSEERSKSVFGDSVVWYPQRKAVKNIPEITAMLAPVIDKIEDLDTLSLQQFLNNGAGDPALTDEQILALTEDDISLEGYAIKIQSADAQWSPPVTNNVVTFEDFVIIEGNNEDENFVATIPGEGGASYPQFYFGKKTDASDVITSVSSIQFPSTAALLIQVFNTGFVQQEFPDVEVKTVLSKYIPPITSNVNYYDISSFQVGEDVVDQFGNFTSSFENQAGEIPQQLEPFFSSNISVPNIDLVGNQSLSLGKGLQGISISIGEDGITTNYSIGTERMRLRSADVFYRYIYDPKKKKQNLEEHWSIEISHKKFYNLPT